MHNSSMTRVPVENVLYFESCEKKVFAAMKNGKYEIKQRLFELEELLISKNFFRISRSVLVNMNKTVGYKVDFDRSLLAVMSDKEELRVSRTNKEAFKQRLERT
jgi:DNA-binding LytR/AlgR family response regulator